MITFLFMFFFGRWSKSEMQWFGNDFVRDRIIKLEQKYIPLMVIIDCFIVFWIGIPMIGK